MPDGETPFSYLSELCWAGARKRYHPVTSAVVKRLAHELDVIERAGLAEFFLICWDLMRFAKEQGIPAQGRGSATSSIVSYTLGISRVEPIAHNLLFERFINPGRTTYPDVDIDFSSERREEVIQYVYERYGPEHTGMVCNLVTYRARSAVREVGYALGFPRPLVDRVAKALETYDSVMVRRDLEADGGFAEFFRRPGEGLPAEAGAAEAAEALGFVDGMGQLNTRMPLVGKVPPWRQPPKPEDPNAPRPFAWLREAPEEPGGPAGSRIPGCGRALPSRRRRSGRAADPTTRVVRATPRPASPGCGRAAGPATRRTRTGWSRRRSSTAGGSTRRAASSSRRRAATEGRATDKLGRPDAAGIRRRRAAPTRAPRLPSRRSPGSSRSRRRRPAAARRSASRDWERWLEFCARIDGFPRHLSIHSGGMLVTAAPLIDIAPIERATMVDRVVVQFDKRDVETLKLIKLDLLGLGMLAAMDETLQLIEHDCAVCLDLDRLPEDVPEVFEMLQAADTVGVFQVESRAQMQTLPKSRPQSLDDLVVEVAIIRPGPIQGNAVHPFLRRKQGLEPVTYLHPSLEPVLKDSMGVILYQEQVMRIAIEVAGFTPAESDGFRRAMGTWRSTREMEKLHQQFLDGCMRQPGMTEEIAEELFRQVAAFASFGFAKSHAAAFARTAYESAFLKLFYPAQFLVGLINAQPMGFYPVEVLVNDTKRHGVAVLPVDINASVYKTTTEWVGRPGEPLPDGAGIAARPEPVRSPACVVPSAAARDRWTPEVTAGWGVRLGLAPRQGDRRAARGAAGRGAGARAVRDPGRRGRADRAARGGPRAAHPDRGAGLARAAAARAPVAAPRGGRRVTRPGGRAGAARPGPGGRQAGGGGRAADGPAAARDRGPGTPRHHRIGADRRCLRGDRAGCPAPGRDALPAGARPAGGGDQCGALGEARRAGSGSAGWSSPASTR